jgi:hypothetical protein
VARCLLLPPRVRRLILPLFVYAVFACGNHQITFDAQHDDPAMLAVTRVWQGSGVTLSLCEDIAAEPSVSVSGCEVAHVVRGGSRTATTTTNSAKGGCPGGCAGQNSAYVAGQLSQNGLELEVSGVVILGSLYDDDPYAYPYTFELSCPNSGCTATGTLEANGTLHLAIDNGANIDLTPTAASACP